LTTSNNKLPPSVEESSSDEDELPPTPQMGSRITSAPSNQQETTFNVLRLDANSYSELMSNLRRFSDAENGKPQESPFIPTEADFPSVPGSNLIPSAPDFGDDNIVQVPTPSF